MKQLFPKEIIEHTVEVHQFAHRSRSKVIYNLLLISILGGLIALPLVKISVYATARGMLKPNKERVPILAQQSGNVSYVQINDNQIVKVGDTLLTMSTSMLDKQLEVSQTHIQELEEFVTDATYLLESKHVQLSQLHTARYQKEYNYYQQKLQELQTRRNNAKRNYDRTNDLFQRGVLARVEQENNRFEYQVAKNVCQQYKKQQYTSWQTAITGHRQQLLDFQGKRAALQEDEKQLIVKATINGVLKNIQGIAIGSFVTAGSVLAEISPDTELIAECYVAPSDIGLLANNTNVNLQIDAFHYNQWGLATACIMDISKDIDMQNNQPVFKVRCAVAEDHLTLQNDFKGYFKKGMTFNARFELNERTLFQLLYDKVDDWLNPGTNNLAQSTR